MSNISCSCETQPVFVCSISADRLAFPSSVCTQSIPGFLQIHAMAPLIPTPMSFTYMSTTLKICKVNIRNEKDWLSV